MNPNTGSRRHQRPTGHAHIAVRRRPLLALGAVSLAIALGAPVQAQPRAAAGAALALGATGHSVTPPVAWKAAPPASQYRLAQWVVPGRDGEAEAIVFYFGPGQGGSVLANIDRWASQFTTPDGKPVEPKIERGKSGALPMTTVELAGQYARGVGSGPQGQSRANQMLISSVVEGPKGNVTFQLHGPRPTVEANRAAFMAMVRGMKSPN